jgi:presenilin-like A22 family membrane protease
MKHSTAVTLILLVIFILAQYVGLAVTHQYIDTEQTEIIGEVVFSDLPIGERPDLDATTSYITIILAILIGTGILLLLIKYKAFKVWRFWFFLAVLMTTTITFGAFIHKTLAIILAFILATWKIYKPNPIIHNLTEIFIYAGLAAIFVPVLSLQSILILLALISVYDMYAVWKSKHMIVLANAQTQAKVFAGLMIPYTLDGFKKKMSLTIKSNKVSKKETKKQKTNIKEKITQHAHTKTTQRIAVLGGGDIGFPLLFAGVILKTYGVIPSLIIPLFSTAGLALLFMYGKKDRFYPAMPFLTVACLIGFAFVWLIGLV